MITCLRRPSPSQAYEESIAVSTATSIGFGSVFRTKTIVPRHRVVSLLPGPACGCLCTYGIHCCCNWIGQFGIVCRSSMFRSVSSGS